MKKFSPQKFNARHSSTGLNDTELAAAVGVTADSVANWRTGRRTPQGAVVIARLCEVLKCEIGQLMDG